MPARARRTPHPEGADGAAATAGVDRPGQFSKVWLVAPARMNRDQGRSYKNHGAVFAGIYGVSADL